MVLALLSLTLLMIDGSALRQRGRTFLTFIAFLCGSVLVWIGYDYSQQYSTWFSLTVGFLLALGALGVFIVLLTEAHELAEAVWAHKRRREFLPVVATPATARKCRSTCPATTSRRRWSNRPSTPWPTSTIRTSKS